MTSRPLAFIASFRSSPACRRQHPQHVRQPVGVPMTELAQAGDRELGLLEREVVPFGDEPLEPAASSPLVPFNVFGCHQHAEVDGVEQAQPAKLPGGGLGLHQASDLEGALEPAAG